MKVRCKDYRCGWHGDSSEVLVAGNPFDPTQKILGCPGCKQIESIERACDDPDCWEPVASGYPTPDGYRMTCSKAKIFTKSEGEER